MINEEEKRITVFIKPGAVYKKNYYSNLYHQHFIFMKHQLNGFDDITFNYRQIINAPQPRTAIVFSTALL